MIIQNVTCNFSEEYRETGSAGGKKKDGHGGQVEGKKKTRKGKNRKTSKM